MAGFYHGLNGVGITARRLGVGAGFGPLRARSVAVASGFAALMTVAALLGLGGIWFDVGDVQSSAFAQLARDVLGIQSLGAAP